jgi:hypothetical protein
MMILSALSWGGQVINDMMILSTLYWTCTLS